jgi:hypothetical protein
MSQHPWEDTYRWTIHESAPLGEEEDNPRVGGRWQKDATLGSRRTMPLRGHPMEEKDEEERRRR